MSLTETEINLFLSHIEINDVVTEGKRQVGDNLRKVREKSGYTQQEIGNYLGISYQQISGIERGTHGFSYERAAKACEFMDSDINELFRGTKEICLTNTYLTQFIGNSASLCYANSSNNRKFIKEQKKNYEKVKNETEAILEKREIDTLKLVTN